MNTKLAGLMFSMFMVFAGCTSAGAPGTVAAPAEDEQLAQSEDDPNRIVCRREHVVGSNFKQRVCRTVKQINEERLASQQKLEQERLRMTQKALPPPRGN